MLLRKEARYLLLKKKKNTYLIKKKVTNAYPIKQIGNFLIKIKEFKDWEKTMGFFLEIFALIYASQVSSELRLLRGGSHRGRCFYSQREQQGKNWGKQRKGQRASSLVREK